MKRRERTRHLIELGGLVVKAGLVDLTDDDRATLYGAFLTVADKLRGEGGGKQPGPTSVKVPVRLVSLCLGCSVKPAASLPKPRRSNAMRLPISVTPRRSQKRSAMYSGTWQPLRAVIACHSAILLRQREGRMLNS